MSQLDLVASSVLLAVSFVMITFIVCCLVRMVRRRRRQKRQHFARLVNDLNATEKFSIVSPSDDEVSE